MTSLLLTIPKQVADYVKTPVNCFKLKKPAKGLQRYKVPQAKLGGYEGRIVGAKGFEPSTFFVTH